MQGFYKNSSGDRQVDASPNSNRVYGIDVFNLEKPGVTVTAGTAYLGADTVGQPALVSGTLVGLQVPKGQPVGTVVPLRLDWTLSNGESDSRTIYLNIVVLSS